MYKDGSLIIYNMARKFISCKCYHLLLQSLIIELKLCTYLQKFHFSENNLYS